MLKIHAFTVNNERNTNLGLFVMQNPGFTYLHSEKRSRVAASLRLSA